MANPHRKAEIVNQWVKDCLTEYAESFPQVSVVLEANIDRCIYGQKGFEDHTFQEMWELYSQYSTQKDRPEQFSDEQRETIKRANSSVRRWLNTPLTHITSVQMKRFRKYINDKDQVSVMNRKSRTCNLSNFVHYKLLCPKILESYITFVFQQQKQSTSKCDFSSWPGGDGELLAACQAVEGKGDTELTDTKRPVL